MQLITTSLFLKFVFKFLTFSISNFIGYMYCIYWGDPNDIWCGNNYLLVFVLVVVLSHLFLSKLYHHLRFFRFSQNDHHIQYVFFICANCKCALWNIMQAYNQPIFFLLVQPMQYLKCKLISVGYTAKKHLDWWGLILEWWMLWCLGSVSLA